MNATETTVNSTFSESTSNETFSTDGSPTELISNIPENSIHYESIAENISNENNSSVNILLSNGTQDYNETIYNVSIQSSVQKYNITVFSDYPPELLCIGALYFILFAIVGVIGNFVSILALSKSKRLRNATTVFIVNLCIADLLFCSFSMPLSALTFIEQNWNYGDLLCKLFPLIRYSNGAVSIFSVIAITINRYILIVHPAKYNKLYKKKNLAIMIALIWVMSLFLLMFPLFEIWGTLGWNPKVGTCTILKLNDKSPKTFLYTVGFGLPSVIFVACYARIYLVVRKAAAKTRRKTDDMNSGRISFTSRKGWLQKNYRHSEMTKVYVHHRDKKELRILKVMLVVFILFILCYFPVSFVKILNKEYDLPILNVLGYLGVYFSNIINPVIYIVMSKEYRKAYKELFCQAKMKKKSIMGSL